MDHGGTGGSPAHRGFGRPRRPSFSATAPRLRVRPGTLKRKSSRQEDASRFPGTEFLTDGDGVFWSRLVATDDRSSLLRLLKTKGAGDAAHDLRRGTADRQFRPVGRSLWPGRPAKRRPRTGSLLERLGGVYSRGPVPSCSGALPALVSFSQDFLRLLKPHR